jgi:hypothetical protein
MENDAMRTTRAQFWAKIWDEYHEAGESLPPTAKKLAHWAIRTGRWQPHRDSILSQCAREAADALREEYYTDPQGRRVRKKHVYAEKQEMLWADIEEARPEQMERSFALRRRQILGDCHQLKIDADSYNDNNAHGAAIQLMFDFRDDLAEMEAASLADAKV